MDINKKDLSPFMKELLAKNERLYKRHGHSWDYLQGVAITAAKMLNVKLDEQTLVLWIAMLGKLPKWQLLHLDNYPLTDYNRNIAALCLWLGNIEPEPERVSQIDQGLKRIDFRPNLELGRTVLEYSKDMMSGKYSHEELLEKELTFMKRMRIKYPHIDWVCGMKDNKGK